MDRTEEEEGDDEKVWNASAVILDIDSGVLQCVFGGWGEFRLNAGLHLEECGAHRN